MTFSVAIKKELDNGKTITYKLKFTDSFRFMSTSLSKLVKKKIEIKTENLSVSLKDLKITNVLVGVVSVRTA